MERLVEEIRQIATEYSQDRKIAARFIKRLNNGNLTRDENPYSHFTVYFAAYDPQIKKIFLGHHIKSGLWLFNGGHIDRDESLLESLIREIQEEWGIVKKLSELPPCSMLTITEISPNQKQVCKTHYDIWYFLPINSSATSFNSMLLKKEFYETKWTTTEEGKQLVVDPSTLKAISVLNDNKLQ